jgi:hypothetical protein
MISRLLKLVIVALILNALWRAGSAYWEFYQFRDAVLETAQFSASKTDAEVHDRVVQQATDFAVPVDPDAIHVRRDGQHTYIDVAYVRNVELVPKMKPRPWPFKVSVDAWAARQEIPSKPLSPR